MKLVLPIFIYIYLNRPSLDFIVTRREEVLQLQSFVSLNDDRSCQARWKEFTKLADDALRSRWREEWKRETNNF